MSQIKYEISTRSGQTAHVAFITKTRHAQGTEKPFKASEAVRIIGNDINGYRIDFAGNVAGAWLPWEAVTEQVYTCLANAKAAVRAYAV